MKLSEQGIFNKNVANKLKGIAAIGVVCSHVLSSKSYFILKYFTKGYLWVGVFFFLSGYGLAYSSKTKDNYMTNFIFKKFVQIYLPFVIAQAIYLVIVNCYINKIPFKMLDLICVAGIGVVNPVLWYILEILVIYTIFFIIKKYFMFKQEDIIWCFLTFVIILVLLTLDIIFDIGSWWYTATSVYFFGYVIGNHDEEASADKGIYNLVSLVFFSQNIFVWLVKCIIFFILIWMDINPEIWLQGEASNYVNYILIVLYIVEVPIFLSLVEYICRYISEKRNIVSFLGNISYEIYLVHMIVKNISDKLCDSYSISYIEEIIFIFGFTFVFAYIFHIINNRLKFILYKNSTSK